MSHFASLWDLAEAGGCAAKLGPRDLDWLSHDLHTAHGNSENVIAGLAHRYDAAIVSMSSDRWLVQTVDFIAPVSPNPDSYGKIAAANALSDVYAMGGDPSVGLNICCFPRGPDLREEVRRVLYASAAVMKSAGAEIVGGHTVVSSRPLYGLAITGTISPGKVRSLADARSGHGLVLTKAIGTGLYISAFKQQLIGPRDFAVAESSMISLNRDASIIMRRYGAGACTDVTGFGLLGHAVKMAVSSNVRIQIWQSDLPLFARAGELVNQGVTTSNSKEIGEYYGGHVPGGLRGVDAAVLCDPQTSGGLLISVPSNEVADLVDELQNSGLKDARAIGEIVPGPGGSVELL